MKPHLHLSSQARAGRLGSDDFIQGSALPFESRCLVAAGNRQVAVESKLRVVHNRTMPWDDDRVVRDFGKIGFSGSNILSMLSSVEWSMNG